MKKEWLKWGILYVALIFICVLVIYIIPSVRGILVKTYLAEQGEVSLTNEVEAYVVRDEKVYVAKNSADVKRVAEVGKLVKAGTKVVEMTGEGVPTGSQAYLPALSMLGKKVRHTSKGKTKYAGYIVYKIDGAEGALRPSKVKKLTHEDLEKYLTLGLKDTVKGQCAAEDPIFKVVKNGKYYLICYMNNEDAEHYSEGATVTVTLDGKDIPAQVYYIKKAGEETKVVLKCGTLYKNCFTDRKVKPTITIIRAKGLILQDDSIIEKDGKQGVLVKNKLGKYVFKPICIKADDGKQCAVYQDIYMDEKGNFVETISIYDEVIASPSDKDIEDAE